MATSNFPLHGRRTLLAAAIGAALTSIVAHAAPVLGIQGRRVLASNAWIEVDLSVFEQNLRHVQGALTGDAQLCAIMKADAYGVGIASTEEARVVRASGFKGRLMRVRNATPAEVEAALPYAVEELVGNLELAQSIGEIARKHRHTVRVHLGLNSAGMSRNGLELGTDKGREHAQALVKTQGLRIVGVMTHFAVEERPDVLNGLEAFKRETAWLFANTRLQRGDVMLHVANSFATLNVPEAHLDMVRTGAALYGYVGPRPAFQHVVSFKSRVASVNAYPAGNTVGYDRTFTLKRNSLLANLPMGYSDGYRRAYTNKGSVLVRGQRAPVVGKVSMNTTMVDVTDIPGVKSETKSCCSASRGTAKLRRQRSNNSRAFCLLTSTQCGATPTRRSCGAEAGKHRFPWPAAAYVAVLGQPQEAHGNWTRRRSSPPHSPRPWQPVGGDVRADPCGARGPRPVQQYQEPADVQC